MSRVKSDQRSIFFGYCKAILGLSLFLLGPLWIKLGEFSFWILGCLLAFFWFYAGFKAEENERGRQIIEEAAAAKKKAALRLESHAKALRRSVSRIARFYRDGLSAEKLQSLKSIRSSTELRRLSPYGFELFVAEVFRELGYSAEVTPATGDGGKDIILRNRDGKKIFVECKKYGPDTILGRPELQKFWAVIEDEGAHEGWVVNLGRFSIEAEEWANRKGIKLIDEHQFAELMEQASMYELSASTLDVLKKRLDSELKPLTFVVPCPVCGNEFILPAGEHGRHCDRNIFNFTEIHSEGFSAFIQNLRSELRIETTGPTREDLRTRKMLRAESRRYWAKKKSAGARRFEARDQFRKLK